MTVTENARPSPPDPNSAAVAASLSNAPRFRFRNLGPVRDAELELGDLTLLVGRNNTGKTYIAYTLYGFLKRWRAMSMDEVPELVSDPVTLPFFRRALTRGSTRLPMTAADLNEHRRSAMSAYASGFSSRRLPSVFNAAPSAFSEASCECVPADLPRSAYRELGFSAPEMGSWRFRLDGNEVLFEQEEPPREPNRGHAVLAARMWLAFLFPDLRMEPFALCDERFGISLFYRELDFTKSQLVDLLQNLKDGQVNEETAPYLVIERGASRYAMPIKDNIDYTRSLPDLLSDRSAFFGQKHYNRIRDMMGAYYRVEGDGSIRLRSHARKRNEFDIPLHLASSSARGFSDFYFFLRHTASENHLLIVDEPETHLDPENQMLLARLLSRLVGSGLRILVTTHSDYLLKELNNLMMLHGIGGAADEPDLDYAPEDALDLTRVRAYTAGSGRLAPCQIDEYGMNIPLFETAIDKINHASHALTTRVRTRRSRE